jgi:hypothetical protein
MKAIAVLALAATLLSVVSSCGQEASSAKQADAAQADRSGLLPLDVVNERMSAYNRHDLTAFLITYSDGVEIRTYPDISLGDGKDHLRSIFEPMFQDGSVQVDVHHQFTKDSYVVNHETVTDGDSTTEYVSIYEVRDGLIQSVAFVRD